MKVRAYAKVNLSLEVYAQREDGYHALRSVVLPISLSDEITLTSAAVLVTDSAYATADLAFKAAQRLKAAAEGDSENGTLPAVAISTEKAIPVGGGLGGGSADAAAVLLALNDFWHLNWTPEALAELGAEIGSDVPALVLAMAYRSPVLMEGRGERVTRLSKTMLDSEFLPSEHLVLVNPGVNSSTAEVYARAPGRERPTTAPINDLQAPAVGLYPEIAAALKSLAAAGAVGTRMSGSGATVFGFAATAAEAEAIVAAMRQRGLRAWTAMPL